MMEAHAWEQVADAAGNAGLRKALQDAHEAPLLAKQLYIRLHALGFAVYRGLMTAAEAHNVISKSQEQSWSGQITALEDLLDAMATPLHKRDPKLRGGIPYLPQAQLPPGAGFFPAELDWAALHRMVDACEPCFCEANGDRRPRPHHHTVQLRAA